MNVRMGAIKHKIMILSGKGGVGKSSTAVNLAIALSKQNKKVGLLDIDICGPSLAKMFGIEEEKVVKSDYGWIPITPKNHPNIKIMSIAFLLPEMYAPVMWRGPRKTTIIKRFLKDTLWSRLDYLIIDTPPGTSDEHLSIVSFLKTMNPDGALLVTTPQEVAVSTIRKEIDFCKKMKINILGLVENMSGFLCPCCSELTQIFPGEGGKKLSEEYKIDLVAQIPIDPNLGLCGEEGEDFVTKFSESNSSKIFMELGEKIVNSLLYKDDRFLW
eukprot:TRINITY_DN7639_c0_g1_i1.p1 TRINITY_DN7639_c0_g1~~TRINITY_DN7639_c0_g1_i1.p1  ORF type:complete len:317 (-),score=85.74 TRINITY_DN7639_c0_g1_i1:8-820(-)